MEVKIGLSKVDIAEKHNTFVKQNPSGEMLKEVFIKSPNLSFQNDMMIDDSGTMDFNEFMMASNCTHLSSAKDKLEWIFKVFDEDGGGSIDIDEVIKLVIGLFNMNGKEEDKEVLLACVLDILEVIEVDSNGEITRDEFVNNAMKSGFIQNILGGEEKD